MKNLAVLILLSFILHSCSSTKLVSISVLKPAPVTLPSHVRSVGIINRSLPLDKSKAVDVMDKIISLEGANLDKEGSAASVTGLANELNKNTRFTAVNSLNLPELGNNTPNMYPAPLSWNVVERICKENQMDALFSLELFDTDSKVSYAAHPVKVSTPFGMVPAVEQEATMETMVKAGWRIYDPKTRYVLDEFAIARQLRYKGRGINPVMAVNALIGRKEAVREVGSRAGEGYAFRVLPYWIRVSRDYYVRGNETFKIARRKAQTGNWQEAGKLWKEETINGKRKLAGRACYNMAIVSEIEGNLDAAIEWAQRAYEEHKNRLALNYVRILQRRKVSNNILEAQQTEEEAAVNNLGKVDQ